MIVKKYNSNEYVIIKENDFNNKKHFYEYVLYIQYNILPVQENTINKIKNILKL